MNHPHSDAEWRRLATAGLECARRGDFFAAHEEWEELWLELAGQDKLWVQSLIQAVVALHHAAAGNAAGAGSLKEKASRKLERLATEAFEPPAWAQDLPLPAPLALLSWLRRWNATAAARGGEAVFPF